MSRDQLLKLVSGTLPAGWAAAFTWITPEIAAAATGKVEPAEALTAYALSAHADGALIESRQTWAPTAVGSLSSAGIATIWAIDGYLGRLAVGEGWPAALRASTDSANLESRLREAEVAIERDLAAAQEAAPDVLLIADDLAGDEWLVAPDTAEALVGRYGRLLPMWPGPKVFHSDGDIARLLPSLAQAGFSAVHFGVSRRAQISSLFEEAWNAGLCPIGGIPTTGIVDVSAIVDLARRGPCIIADDGGIASLEEAEKFAAAISALRSALAATVS